MLIDFSSPWFWFSISILLLVFEMLIPGTFFAAIFSISALFVGFLSLLISDIYSLSIIFTILSLIGIFVAKPILEKHFKVNKEVRPSTVDALIGMKGVVISAPSDLKKGRAKVGHEDWAFESLSGEILSVSDEIIVRKIEGATLIVEKYINGGEV